MSCIFKILQNYNISLWFHPHPHKAKSKTNKQKAKVSQKQKQCIQGHGPCRGQGLSVAGTVAKQK